MTPKATEEQEPRSKAEMNAASKSQRPCSYGRWFSVSEEYNGITKYKTVA